MNICILLNIDQNYVDLLKNLLPEHNIQQLNPKDEKTINSIKKFEIIIGAYISPEILKNASSLVLYQVPWVGLNNVDFDTIKALKNPIKVCNSKWNNRIVAEYALTLLLSLMKHIVPVHNNFSKGSWGVKFLQSKQLTNSKVLLIGFGSIGKEIAKLIQPFSSEIYALRNKPEKSTEKEKLLVKEIIGWDKYDEIIPEIDFIVNSLPLTEKTKNILNEERILAMNSNALFVNVGRGKTVSEKALYKALKNNKIAGAALDVWFKYKTSKDKEPFFPSDYPYHELNNVIMSPHRAATFQDTPDTIWDDTVYNVRALENGNPLKNVISYDEGY